MKQNKRFGSNFYCLEKIGYRRGEDGIIKCTLPGGYLYAGGSHPTKIKPEELPEWYVYGSFYRRWGWMCCKGVTDIYYKPNWSFNHFLKDDFLFIAYGHEMEISEDTGYGTRDLYPSNYDELVYGGSILTILAGIKRWSDADIEEIVKMIEQKAEYIKKKWPDEFGDFKFEREKYGL